MPSGGAVGKALALGATLAFVTLVGLRAGPAASRPAPAAASASPSAPAAASASPSAPEVTPEPTPDATSAISKPRRSLEAGGTAQQNERSPEAVGAAPSAAGILPDGRVVLNVASEQELTQLPGVGPARAKAIFALRSRLGRFRSLNDLRRVKGIGRRSLERLRSHAVLDPPS